MKTLLSKHVIPSKEKRKKNLLQNVKNILFFQARNRIRIWDEKEMFFQRGGNKIPSFALHLRKWNKIKSRSSWSKSPASRQRRHNYEKYISFSLFLLFQLHKWSILVRTLSQDFLQSPPPTFCPCLAGWLPPCDKNVKKAQLWINVNICKPRPQKGKKSLGNEIKNCSKTDGTGSSDLKPQWLYQRIKWEQERITWLMKS